MADITPADIELLTRELNLKETTPTTLHALATSFGRDWFLRFKSMNREEVEWEDEYSACYDCGKLVRTESDSMWWKPTFTLDDNGIHCEECGR